jgi:uncharacterized membrane protein
MRPALRFVAGYVLLSALLGGVALLLSFPARPTSWPGWLLLLALAVPVAIAAEFLGDFIFRNPVVRAVERRTKDQSFSWLRILVAVPLMFLVFAVVFVIGKFFS